MFYLQTYILGAGRTSSTQSFICFLLSKSISLFKFLLLCLFLCFKSGSLYPPLMVVIFLQARALFLQALMCPNHLHSEMLLVVVTIARCFLFLKLTVIKPINNVHITNPLLKLWVGDISHPPLFCFTNCFYNIASVYQNPLLRVPY